MIKHVVHRAVRESSVPELAGLVARLPVLGFTTPLGYGRPVLLVPGFGAADASLEVLARWLRSRGYRTYRSRIGVNVGCSERQYQRLEKRLEHIAGRTGGPVAIVGHSRGGILAKALAAARPDLVAGIVTLGAPTRTVRPTGVPHAKVVARLVGSGHLPNLLSWRCVRGTCPPRFARAVTAPFPTSVGYVSVYSRTDRIAPWQSCKHPAATHVEVVATHLGLAHNAEVCLALARALPGFWPGKDGSWLVRMGKQAIASGRTVVIV